MTRIETIRTHALPTALLALVLLALQACTIGASTRLVSMSGRGRVKLDAVTAVYAPTGETGAQVFLTDLPRDKLARGTDLSDTSGHLIQINMFLTPRPGRTPIDPTASNASIRWIVIAKGEIGVYSGGGFVQPSELPGEDVYAANVKGATLELTARTPRFRDALGPSRMHATVRTPKDEAYARLLAARVDEIIASLEQP